MTVDAAEPTALGTVEALKLLDKFDDLGHGEVALAVPVGLMGLVDDLPAPIAPNRLERQRVTNEARRFLLIGSEIRSFIEAPIVPLEGTGVQRGDDRVGFFEAVDEIPVLRRRMRGLDLKCKHRATQQCGRRPLRARLSDPLARREVRPRRPAAEVNGTADHGDEVSGWAFVSGTGPGHDLFSSTFFEHFLNSEKWRQPRPNAPRCLPLLPPFDRLAQLSLMLP